MMKIPFNKPYIAESAMERIRSVVDFGHLSGNGPVTQKVHHFFRKQYGYQNVFLTTSCTHAFEMAVLLMQLNPGDEVIMPSYTFVSTTNPFILQGARIVFADSSADHPNIDLDEVEALINPKTKVLVVMHYGGVAVDMDRAREICDKHNLILFEDVAHAIDATYKGRPLGSFGDFAAFSFHETKNITCGEGGLLVVNRKDLVPRAEIVWEKGTNRTAFERGEVAKYEWVDVGASFVPSEVSAALLYDQLKMLNSVQKKRIALWERYQSNLKTAQDRGLIKLAQLPEFASNNGHVFWFTVSDLQARNKLLSYLNDHMVHAVFHYLPLHNSPYYRNHHDGRSLPNTDYFSQTLIRLPLFYELTIEAVDYICAQVYDFYDQH